MPISASRRALIGLFWLCWLPMAPRILLALSIIALSSSLTGCPSKESLAFSVVADGVINDPSNKSLRFDLLKFGLAEFCKQMTQSGAPLKVADDMPVAGRFFSSSCQHQVLDTEDRKSLVVQYNGSGYGWTNLSGRIGFRSSGLVEYAPDFQVQGEAMYIYFRPRNIDASSFETLMVESAAAQGGLNVALVDPDRVGTTLVKGQLRRGFTVIRYNDRGETDFSLGFVPVGEKPRKPYVVESTNRVSLTNDRTEVHTGQQDYIGSFEIAEDDQALYFTAKLDGTGAIDVALVPRSGGEEMLQQFVKSPGAATLAMPPLLQETVRQGETWQRGIKLSRGSYMLVVDHSTKLGQASPPTHPADSPAHLSYLVQRGDAD
jgi:hypothetical protein